MYDPRAEFLVYNAEGKPRGASIVKNYDFTTVAGLDCQSGKRVLLPDGRSR